MTDKQEYLLNHYQICLIIESLEKNNNKNEEIQTLIEMFEQTLFYKDKKLNDFVTEY